MKIKKQAQCKEADCSAHNVSMERRGETPPRPYFRQSTIRALLRVLCYPGSSLRSSAVLCRAVSGAREREMSRASPPKESEEAASEGTRQERESSAQRRRPGLAEAAVVRGWTPASAPEPRSATASALQAAVGRAAATEHAQRRSLRGSRV